MSRGRERHDAGGNAGVYYTWMDWRSTAAEGGETISTHDHLIIHWRKTMLSLCKSNKASLSDNIIELKSYNKRQRKQYSLKWYAFYIGANISLAWGKVDDLWLQHSNQAHSNAVLFRGESQSLVPSSHFTRLGGENAIESAMCPLPINTSNTSI